MNLKNFSATFSLLLFSQVGDLSLLREVKREFKLP